MAFDVETVLEKAKKLNGKCFFIYGNDEGMVNFAQSSLIKKLEDGQENTYFFSYKEVLDSPSAVHTAMHSSSLFGERNLVVITEMPENLPSSSCWLFDVARNSIVILSAGEIKKSSKLYNAANSHANVVVIPCYQMDKEEMAKHIYNQINSLQKVINYDLCHRIAEILPNNIILVNNELSKLVSYVGTAQEIQLEDCCNVFSNNETLIFDQVAAYIILGNKNYLRNKIYNLVHNEEDYMLFLRVIGNYIRRVILVKQSIENGITMEDALQRLKPPLFFKYKAIFLDVVQKTNLNKLKRLSRIIVTTELNIKKFSSSDKKEYFTNGIIDLFYC